MAVPKTETVLHGVYKKINLPSYVCDSFINSFRLLSNLKMLFLILNHAGIVFWLFDLQLNYASTYKKSYINSYVAIVALRLNA